MSIRQSLHRWWWSFSKASRIVSTSPFIVIIILKTQFKVGACIGSLVTMERAASADVPHSILCESIIRLHRDNDVSLLLSCFNIAVRLGNLFHRIASVDDRLELSRRNEFFEKTKSSVLDNGALNTPFLPPLIEVNRPRPRWDKLD
jgi:hypothetical protein